MGKNFIFRKRKEHQSIVDAVPSVDRSKVKRAESLGCGEMSEDYKLVVAFRPSPSKTGGDSTTTMQISCSTRDIFNDIDDDNANHHCLKQLRSIINSEKILDNIEHLTEKIRHVPAEFLRKSSSYIRVTDLHLITPSIFSGEERCANFHHASRDPPPGVELDPNEEWVALDDGAGSHAPIAPYAVEALKNFGMHTAMDQSMWKEEGKTGKLLKSTAWGEVCWQRSGAIRLPNNFPDHDVLVWSGNFVHELYGSDMSAVRAEGIIEMSPKALLEMLIDSSRTTEYNKYSLGRKDLLVLQDNMEKVGPFGKSITKVVLSETHTPVVKRKVQLVTLIHVTELEDSSGYIFVSRAVTRGSEAGADKGVFDSLRSEILMGVNVIRKIEGCSDRSLLINVSHLRPPMVPHWLVKKISISAAPSFFHDMRARSAELDK